MPTLERAIVLSHLQLGQAPLARELCELIEAAASGPATEVIVAGGLLGPGAGDLGGLAAEGLGALGRALRSGLRLTLLPGPGEEALAEPAGRQRLLAALGCEEGQVSFGEELRPGMIGRRLVAGDGVAWVTTGAGLDPTGGLSLPELLSWGQLRSFLRAWARQLAMGRQLPPAEGPYQLTAQALARAVYEVARGREERTLTDLQRFLEAPGEPDEQLLPVLRRGELLLREAYVQRVRGEVDDAAVAVVLGTALPHEADEDAPTVVMTGAAMGDSATWVEIGLGASLRLQLRGLRPTVLAPSAPPAQPPPAVPPQPTPTTPPQTAQTPTQEAPAAAQAPASDAQATIPSEESVEMAVPSDGAPAAPSSKSRRGRRGKDKESKA